MAKPEYWLKMAEEDLKDAKEVMELGRGLLELYFYKIYNIIINHIHSLRPALSPHPP